MTNALLSYEEAWSAGPEVVGGKGWNLGRLHRFGFPIPRGGVMAADVYRQVLSDTEITRWVAELGSVTTETVESPEVATRLSEIRSRIIAAAIPDEVRAAVQEFLETLGIADLPVAVRSSATAEDGAHTSFAGIHESQLNVMGLDAVIQAALECYASLWTPRALAYRRRFGLNDADVACAAVICEMVRGPDGPPVAAGVAFSCDPVTGRRDVIQLSAVPGLGEALVSGAVNPEEWTFISEQFHMIVERRTGPSVLTPRWAEELAVLVTRVHWALGDGQNPQDIEWVFDGKRWWLVQARPVTRVPRLVPPGARGLPIIWSNANLKDVLPGVPTAMSWEGTQSVVRLILLVNLQTAGYDLPLGMETMRRIDGRAYFDLTLIQWCYYDALGILPRDINASFGGGQPEIPVPSESPSTGKDRRRRGLAMLRLMRALWANSRTLPAEMVRMRAVTRAEASCSLGALTGPELINHLRDGARSSLGFARQFQLANGSTLWYGMLESTLERFRPGQSRPLASALMSGSGGVVSANHGYRIADLARAAEQDPPARIWIESDPRDSDGWRSLDSSSPFRRAMEQFLFDFGHRAVYELELANPRWNDDPSYIVDQVRQLLASGIPQASPASAQARRRTAEAEVDKFPLFARPLVHWLADRARLASAHREESKSVLVSLLEPMRAVALEAGRRLVDAELLDHADDVFHLTWMDVGAYLMGYWDGNGARALVRHRADQRAAWQDANPPDSLVLDDDNNPAVLPSIIAAPVYESAARSNGRELTGVPASAGRASGPARVIHHPDEGYRLQAGDVLVAPSTDPGWTPLFLRASAIVMEVGGYVSHGAIVAREYGIPAVVNVPGVLTRVRDGQMLDVDGDVGKVTLGD